MSGRGVSWLRAATVLAPIRSLEASPTVHFILKRRNFIWLALKRRAVRSLLNYLQTFVSLNALTEAHIIALHLSELKHFEWRVVGCRSGEEFFDSSALAKHLVFPIGAYVRMGGAWLVGKTRINIKEDWAVSSRHWRYWQEGFGHRQHFLCRGRIGPGTNWWCGNWEIHSCVRVVWDTRLWKRGLIEKFASPDGNAKTDEHWRGSRTLYWRYTEIKIFAREVVSP